MAAKKKDNKEKKKKKPFSRYKMYAVSGDKLEKKNSTCPKCSVASYLSNHKDRQTCGKCGYVEIRSKKE